MKARQSAKVEEIAAALRRAGCLTVREQAKALGICRSTAWATLNQNYKNSGISAGTINRMLLSQRLPPTVRAKVNQYIEEKIAGRYGHSEAQRRRFIALLSVKQTERNYHK